MLSKLNPFPTVLVSLLLSAGLIVLLLAAAPVQAATLPAGFSDSLVVQGISSATAFAFARDGRIFVAEKGGSVRVVSGHKLLPTPFTTVTVDTAQERGLVGIALHPDFPTTPYLYIYYTVPGVPAHNRVSRFTAQGNVAKPDSEEMLIELDDLSTREIHNGGAIHFGPDGDLYVAVGDNSDARNAQNLANRLGKMLRYDENGNVPVDNPFHDGDGPNADAVWAMGLRNPFTFAFQRDSGRMFINDVGSGAAEEINDGVAGSNYGWNWCEGACQTPNLKYRDPLYAYAHGQVSDNGCAIVGGAFYNPSTQQFPYEYRGDYFFADWCGGWIHRYNPGTGSVSNFASDIAAPVDLHVSTDGSLYYLARNSGQIRRVTYDNPVGDTPTPTITPTATQTPTVTQTPTITPTFTATPCLVSTPAILKPHADSVLKKARVRLSWLRDSCAEYFRIKFQKQDGTARQVWIVDSAKYRTAALEPGGLYQFRVIACDKVRCKRSKWVKFSITENPKP